MIINNSDIKPSREPHFEHFQGALFIFFVAGEFQELLKGGDVCVDVAIFYAEFLEVLICFDPFGNICVDVGEGFFKFVP